MEILGTPANLAIAEYVFEYLLHAASELWERHRKDPSKPRGNRATFQPGVMHGFWRSSATPRPSLRSRASSG